MKIIFLVLLLVFSICYPSAGSSSSSGNQINNFSFYFSKLTNSSLAFLRKNPVVVKSKPKYLHFDVTLDIAGVAGESLSEDSQHALAETISEITNIPQGNIQLQEELHREQIKNGHWLIKTKILIGVSIDQFPQVNQNGQKLYIYLKTLLKESIKEFSNEPAIFTHLIQKNSILWGRELFYAKALKIDVNNPRLSMDSKDLTLAANSPSSQPTGQPTAQPTSAPTRTQTAPSYYNHNNHYPTDQPTSQPTSAPTRVQTAPSYYNSNPPTFDPTAAPTTAPVLDILQFDVYWDVLNVSTSALSAVGANAFLTTISDVLDLPVGQVHYLGVSKSVLKKDCSCCYELEVQTRLTIPLSEFPEYNYNATKLYIYLTTIMLDSVALDSFTKLLRKDSIKVDAIESFWADVIHVQFLPFNLIASTPEPTVNPTIAPTLSPSAAPTLSPSATPTVSLAPTIPATPGGTPAPTNGGGSGWATGSPTRSPTSKPTQQTKDILIYQATFTLRNSSSNILTATDYTTFFHTIGSGLNMQISNIKLLNNSHTLNSAAASFQTYEVLVNVDLTFDLIDYPAFNNATELYLSSSRNLTTSIKDGQLTNILRTFADIFHSDHLSFAYFEKAITGNVRVVPASSFSSNGQSPATKQAITVIILASVISGGIIFLGCVLLAIYWVYSRYQRYQREKKGISSVRIPIEKTISHDMPFDDIYGWERPQQGDLIVIDVDDDEVASVGGYGHGHGHVGIPNGMQSDDDGDDPYNMYPVTVPSRNSMNFSNFELDFEYALSPRQSLNLRNHQIMELNFVPSNHTAESRM